MVGIAVFVLIAVVAAVRMFGAQARFVAAYRTRHGPVAETPGDRMSIRGAIDGGLGEVRAFDRLSESFGHGEGSDPVMVDLHRQMKRAYWQAVGLLLAAPFIAAGLDLVARATVGPSVDLITPEAVESLDLGVALLVAVISMVGFVSSGFRFARAYGSSASRSSTILYLVAMTINAAVLVLALFYVRSRL